MTPAPWVLALRAREELLRRAPSAHNTQPWVLTWTEDALHIGIDPTRALPASDPTGRDLALGLGAFVEGALIVAADAGLAVRVVSGDAAGPVVRLIAAEQPYRTPFTAADLAARRTARGRHHPGPVPAAVLAELEPGLVAVPATDLVADLAVADRWMFATPPVTDELADWLRLHPSHPRYRQDGLTDRALALSRIEAVGLGLALRLRRRVPAVATVLAAAGGGLLRGDHAQNTVLVLCAAPDTDSTDSTGTRVTAGRRLLRTWLALARHGLSVHPLSQLIDCPDTATRLADRVGGDPLAVFRVGHPRTPPAPSARLGPHPH